MDALDMIGEADHVAGAVPDRSSVLPPGSGDGTVEPDGVDGTPMLDAGALYRQRQRLVSRRIRDRVLVTAPQGNFYQLDGFEPRVWERSDHAHVRADLTAPVTVDGSDARTVDCDDVDDELRRRCSPPGSSTPAEPSTDLTEAATGPHAPSQVLRQVAGWLLPGAPPISSPSSAPDAAELVTLARSEHLLGPLLAAVDAKGIDLSDDLVEQVVRGHVQSMRWCMHLEQRLLDVADWFSAAGGVEFLVVKGPAVAHLDDRDPSLRAFSDIDLLVHGRDMDRAIACLEAHGAERRIPQRRAGFDRRFIKSIGLVCGDGAELDVHRSLTGGAHGFRIPLDRIFAQPDTFQVGGEVFSTPNLTHRALHAAYHAIVGSNPPPLRTLRDMAGYITSPAMTPEVLGAEAHLWRGETVLAEAVRATFDAFGLAAPAWQEWLSGVERNPAELAIIERGHHPSGLPVEWSAVRELGWRDRAAFTWAVAMPSRETREQRGLTIGGRVGDGTRRLVRVAREHRIRRPRNR